MTAIQLRLSPSKAEKSNTSAKGLLGITKKFLNFLAILSKLSRSYSTFPLYSGTTLIETAVYSLYNRIHSKITDDSISGRKVLASHLVF